MFLTLDDLSLELHSNHPAVVRAWRRLFAGWPCPASPSAGAGPPDLHLHLDLVEHLPPLPPDPPFFVEQARPFLANGIGRLSVYAADGPDVWLSYQDGALVQVSLAPEVREASQKAVGVVRWPLVTHGRFEDVTFTSLAPMLRRRGYYLIHAFAASLNGRAILLVGQSGSGKTTTGLNLVNNGWGLLSNDVVLLHSRPDGVYALPTPSGISVTTETLQLLPAFQAAVAGQQENNPTGKFSLNIADLPDLVWGEASPVDAIYFPEIADRTDSRRWPLSRTIALARLMEESVDLWDKPVIDDHMSVLARLSRQADCYHLQLGSDVEQLPALIAASA